MTTFKNRVTELLKIQYPIIQGGMVWCSGWRLAAAVSNAGGLGIIGAGSMKPDLLRTHIQLCKANTDKPFGVNVPLLYNKIEETMKVIVEENVKIVISSAGNPKTWTEYFKKHDMTVIHVVSSVKFAKKCEEIGVDAIVAEGFEAGGHNGREETTTFCLIPMVREAVSLPLIAAGGIATGSGMFASMALGAEGVQIGSAFAISEESSAHENFKQSIINANEGDTELIMKQLTPVRLLKNEFYHQVKQAELKGVDKETIAQILGKGRAKLGIFEGDMIEGELEIGQISAILKEIKPAKDILNQIWKDFVGLKNNFLKDNFID